MASGGRARFFAGVVPRILIAALSVTAVLLGLELTVRLTSPHTGLAVSVNAWDPVVGTKQVPNAHGFVITPEYRCDLLINSHGLREREIGFARAPGTRRILCLGDSYTCGYGVAAEESYPRRLERLLRAAAGDDRWEVINAGVGSTGTAQQLAYYESEGYRYGAELVVLGFFPGNDFWDSAFSGLYSLDHGLLVRHRAPSTAAREAQQIVRRLPGYDGLFAHSRLLNLLKSKASRLHFRELGRQAARTAPGGDMAALEDSLARHLVLALADACARHGAGLVVIGIPSAPGDSARAARLRADVEARGVNWVDLAPALRIASAAGETPTYLRDGHWNPVGHRVAAEVVFEALEKSGRVGSRPRS